MAYRWCMIILAYNVEMAALTYIKYCAATSVMSTINHAVA